MNIKALLGFGKKKKKSTTRQKRVKKPRTIKPRAVTVEQIEDPLITVTRQLTQIQQGIAETNNLLHGGFQGLREDHHKILEDQASKQDIEEYKRMLDFKKEELERVKIRIEKKIALLDIDKSILDLISEEKLQSVVVAEKLDIARQYAATRLGILHDLGYVKKMKKGRKVFYRAKGEDK